MSTRTDTMHGRRGGNWLPDDYTGNTVATAPRCDICHQPMTAGQRGRHHACTTDTLVGQACVCPPGCTKTVVGDGPSLAKFGGAACDPACVPCRIHAGRVHQEIVEWRPPQKERKQ